MTDSRDELLTEIRDLLANAIERERIRSDARDAQIAASVEMQRAQARLYRRVVVVGAVVALALLILLIYLLTWLRH